MLDIDNGARFETYVIPGGPGDVILNGAAARLVHPGDKVIVITLRAVRRSGARAATSRASCTSTSTTSRRCTRSARSRRNSAPTRRVLPSMAEPTVSDLLVLGSGVAGLSAAVARPPRRHVGHRPHQGRARVVGDRATRREGSPPRSTPTTHATPPAFRKVASRSTTDPTSARPRRSWRSSTRTHVKGTFFEVGKAIDAEPQITRALYADGQLLGNHSYHHDEWRWLDPRYPELERTQAAFARAIGTCPVSTARRTATARRSWRRSCATTTCAWCCGACPRATGPRTTRSLSRADPRGARGRAPSCSCTTASTAIPTPTARCSCWRSR